ncbi:hypothetical protein K449DRAFT_54475 [Hypoxylon sp. EC38]|nr:hypothetical protein K449DRAFT_54475 [Hypoxylon sp. EC38]
MDSYPIRRGCNGLQGTLDEGQDQKRTQRGERKPRNSQECGQQEWRGGKEGGRDVEIDRL